MPPDSRDIIMLSSRLRYFEDWVAQIEGSPLSAAERQEKVQERGILADIASLRDTLIDGCIRLLPQDRARAADQAEVRRRKADAVSILKQLDLLRRLLRVERRLALACGETPPDPHATVRAGLSLLPIEPARGVTILAQARDESALKSGVREALGIAQPHRIWLYLLLSLLCLALLFLAVLRPLWMDQDDKGQVAGEETETLTSTRAMATPSATATPHARLPGASPQATVAGLTSAEPPTDAGYSAAGVEVSSSSATPVTPSATPVTPSATRTPTRRPTRTPTRTPTRMPTRTPTRTPRRSFVSDVQISFSGLSPSDEHKSCVNGRVLDRKGNGVKGAILQVNNGVSWTEQKPTDGSGSFEFCGLGASRWSVVLLYVPEPKLTKEAVGVIEVNGQEGQFARVFFREQG